MTSATLQVALVSAAVLGFRHGFDYDHIAAISDITSIESNRGRAMRLGLLYSVGHAATVALLGTAVILFQLLLPRGIDRIAERLVGLTLLILGAYVLGSLFTGNSMPRSRFQLITAMLRWAQQKMKSRWHRHAIAALRQSSSNQSSSSYDARSVIIVGIVHGLGAETPSQLGIFLLAAGLGGLSRGFLGLTMFITGLLVMNTIMTAAAAGLFGASSRLPHLKLAVTALTAIYSLAVGFLFLLGASNYLPALS